MSLLLANGHPEAMHYPIGRVWDEADLVVERRNGELVSIGVLIQSATATTGMTASKEAGKNFRKLIAQLRAEIVDNDTDE